MQTQYQVRSVLINRRNRVSSGAAAKSTKKSGVTANLVKPGDVDTSGSDLEIRLSSPKRPDRLPTFVYFL